MIAESREIQQPVRVYRDTSTAPAMKVFGVGITASLFHTLPRAIFRGVYTAVNVMQFTRRTLLAQITATRSCVAGAQVGAAYRCNFAAGTLTRPTYLSIAAFLGLGNDKETAELVAG